MYKVSYSAIDGVKRKVRLTWILDVETREGVLDIATNNESLKRQVKEKFENHIGECDVFFDGIEKIEPGFFSIETGHVKFKKASIDRIKRIGHKI